METLFLVVPLELKGERLDKALSLLCESFTRSAAEKLIEGGRVMLNGRMPNKKDSVSANDRIAVCLPNPVPDGAQPENIPLEIAYEDEDLLVVNKPKGMVVHPAAGNYEGTLVNALLGYCGDRLSGINGVIRPGIVHRIDKETSGLLIVAKNDFAHQGLAHQIKEHHFHREYETVVVGRLKNMSGVIDAPIGRHPVERKKMAVTDKNARPARTHYEVIQELRGYTHARLRLETGRTHQIRVHMAYLGHPVAGDTVYGAHRPVPGLEGQCLHARTIGFMHPRSREWLEITSELPVYFREFLAKISRV